MCVIHKRHFISDFGMTVIPSGTFNTADRQSRSSQRGLLLSRALHLGILLAGVLEAGGGTADGPAEGARDLGLHVPLKEVEDGVPPCVCEVVVG